MDSTASLQRWQQAFEDHPISTTRTLEKQLRAGVANNRDRLRGLVGGNYRELLSTADQITSLDIKTRATEIHISELGQLCGPPPKASTRKDVSSSHTAAELSLQQRCIDATKLSIGRSDLLRAAQLLVISRLLLKSLSDKDIVPASVPALQHRFALQRRHTLLRIDGVLTNPRSTSKMIVQAACAYCLVTSSSSGDVFKYVQRLRLEKLRKTLDVEQSPSSAAAGMLRYILSTSQILKRVFTRAMTDAISNVQRRPILVDLNLVGTGVVGSNELLTLLPEDIRSFSPYFKREPVSPSDIDVSLAQWTSEASDILKIALQQQLQLTDDISDVLSIRRELYTTLLPLYFSSTSSEKLHLSLQQEFSVRIKSLVKARAEELLKIATEFISSTPARQTALDLWQPAVASMQLAGGANAFLGQIKKRRHGTSAAMLKASRNLENWTARIGAVLTAFEELKAIRWRDLLEEPDDDQDESAGSILRALLNETPTEYRVHAIASFKTAVEDFEKEVLRSANECINGADDHDVSTGVHHIRVIRLALQPLRKALSQETVLGSLETTIPKLHQFIADKTAAQVVASMDKKLERLGNARPIELMPSPVAFALLQEVCGTMSMVGSHDVWSTAAVQKLKSCMKDKVFTGTATFSLSDFDLAYLGCALASTGNEVSPRESPKEAKAAQEYWARTKLLFGNLA